MGKKRKISQTRLMNAHDKEGSRRYGKRWETANIGWCSGEDFITTKIYGDKGLLLTSFIEEGHIKHKEEKY